MDDREYAEWSDAPQGLQQGCVLSPLLFNAFFFAAVNVVIQRSSKDEGWLRDLVHLDGIGVGAVRIRSKGGVGHSLRRRRVGGRATMMAAILTVFEVADLTESKKTETKTMLLRAPTETPQTSPLVIEKASERYTQTSPMLYLSLIHI